MTSNAEELTSNLQALLSIHKKALDVLSKANKRDNNEISKIVGISPNTISTILNRAKKYEYVEKVSGKWVKTKKIKGENLYKMAKVKFTKELNPKKGFSKTGKKNHNLLSPLKYYQEAKNMSECYIPIFCLENTIRDFLRNIFKKEKDWIRKRIDSDILEDINKAKKEPYYAHKQRKDDLEYTTLGHLLKIMISNKNWRDISPNLKEKDKRNFISTFQKVLPSRNSTGHCVILNKSDRDLVESRVKEITFMFDFF